MARAVPYSSDLEEPFKISRSKLENHVKCPRCFVLDRKFGVAPPSGPSFTLNSAVDSQLKKEFDKLRETSEPHPFVKEQGLDLIPLEHEGMEEWRQVFKGLSTVYSATNFQVYGAVDDIWVDSDQKWVVVDYKTTAKDAPVTELSDAIYHQGYRRQLDVYAWILAQLGHPAADYGYFFYATARKNDPEFGLTLDFEYSLIRHEIDTSWIEPELAKMKKNLDSAQLPEASETCEMCEFVEKRAGVEG